MAPCVDGLLAGDRPGVEHDCGGDDRPNAARALPCVRDSTWTSRPTSRLRSRCVANRRPLRWCRPRSSYHPRLEPSDRGCSDRTCGAEILRICAVSGEEAKSGGGRASPSAIRADKEARLVEHANDARASRSGRRSVLRRIPSEGKPCRRESRAAPTAFDSAPDDPSTAVPAHRPRVLGCGVPSGVPVGGCVGDRATGDRDCLASARFRPVLGVEVPAGGSAAARARVGESHRADGA
jgi:hypothetical protein